jgi:membrane-associated phospholipid phosphatase
MNASRDILWNAFAAVPRPAWLALTWLGDSGLLLPAAIFIALLLWSGRETRRPALQWCALFAAGGFAIVVSKLAFMGWGVGSARLNFTGISGHTAIATTLWPVALWLMSSVAASRGMPRLAVAVTSNGAPRNVASGVSPAGWVWPAAGWALGAMVGVSRLALRAHSMSEVAAGFMLGMTLSAAFIALARRHARPTRAHPALLLVLLAPLALFGPERPAPTHRLLERIAVRLAGIDRPFRRMDLFGPERGGSLDSPARRPAALAPGPRGTPSAR